MRAEVLNGVEHRRRWSDDEKARIISEKLLPGAKVAPVARRYGISAGLLFFWRRQARADVEAPPRLVPVMIAASDANEAVPAVIASPGSEKQELDEVALKHAPVIELDFESGARLRVFGAADSDLVKAVVELLANE